MHDSVNTAGIAVRVALSGSTIKDVFLAAPRQTLQDALNAAGYEAAGYTIRVNNTSVSLSHDLTAGDFVSLVAEDIKGGGNA